MIELIVVKLRGHTRSSIGSEVLHPLVTAPQTESEGDFEFRPSEEQLPPVVELQLPCAVHIVGPVGVHARIIAVGADDSVEIVYISQSMAQIGRPVLHRPVP